ncbi:MAG: hypothetical protein GEU95_20690 [Rhizobiales bacterium]|nr:hypothetical protein [Hyphomicrobiales bacterium]
MMRQRRSAAVIFRWPLLIGVATGYGLVSALVADGLWDWIASLSLAVPVALAVWFYRRPAQS